MPGSAPHNSNIDSQASAVCPTASFGASIDPEDKYMTHNRSVHTTALLLAASTLVLSGCGAMGLATGVGAAVGVSAAKEGGISSSITDESIRIKISDLWFKRDVDMFRKLNLSVNQGRVLVTGVVQSPEARVEAIRLAWQPKGVKQVINEVRVGEGGSVGNYAQDMWISGQLRTKMTFDKNIQSINYTIETVQGTVYLMGVAQSQTELDRAIKLARQIKGVKEVISYAKLAGEPVTSSAATTSEPGLNPPQGYSDPNTSGYGGSVNPPAVSDPVPLSSGYDTAPSQTYAPSSSGSSSSSIQSEVLPP